jgi:predicted tellurium resistance membrane protein TerC
VLTYVGLKMLLSNFYKIPTILSLTFIALTIGLSILISFLKPEKAKS